MKKLLLTQVYLFINLLIVYRFAEAQLSVPEVEAVYGGRIECMSVISTSSDTTRIFISTQSANSIFYADFYTPSGGTPSYNAFTVMPGVDDEADYGSQITKIAADENSGYLFFIHQTGLLSTHPSSSAVNTVVAGNINSLLIFDSHLFYIQNNNELHFGTIDASGTYTESGSSTSGTLLAMPRMVLNSVTNKLCIFDVGTAPSIYVSDDTYDNITSSTSFSSISTSGLSSSYNWNSVGFAPDGKIIVAGDLNTYISFASSTDDGATWTTVNTGIFGIAGPNIEFSGNSSSYITYCAKCYSIDQGATWMEFGNVSFETHPNDGYVLVDPHNPSIVYLTSDQGIASTTDGGPSIFEIDDGVEAVQVNDFDMNSAKTVAWLASKAGIRKVSDFLTSPTWTVAIFPNNDGAPYYSAEMKGDDTDVVYVGNQRVYKSEDGGLTWAQLFTAEDPPYNFDNIWSRIEAIEVCPYDNNIVMAGYHIEGTDKGGLFCSMDDGANWSQILIEASSDGHDVDVNDIIFTMEGTDTVAYIGVYYDLSDPQGRSVYRIVKSGDTWTASQDMNPDGTSTGSVIVATIEDLAYSSTKDTIFASGTDAGNNHPIAYYKIISGDDLWTPFTTTGFPFVEGKEGKAIEFGNDTVFCAVDNEIYYIAGSYSGTWTTGYVYPVGTQINVLYYDELLVGTGTGLYGQVGTGTTSIETEVGEISTFELKQNYPNPFNPTTKIEFIIPERAEITLDIYDIRGRVVSRLINKDMREEGSYSIEFNGRNLPSGIYFCKIFVDGSSQYYSQSRKMVLIK